MDDTRAMEDLLDAVITRKRDAFYERAVRAGIITAEQRVALMTMATRELQETRARERAEANPPHEHYGTLYDKIDRHDGNGLVCAFWECSQPVEEP